MNPKPGSRTVISCHLACRATISITAVIALLAAGCGTDRAPATRQLAIDEACGQGPERKAITSLACFERVDVNGNGSITQDEAVLVPVLSARFQALDQDRSGALTPGELNAAFGQSPAAKAGALGF